MTDLPTVDEALAHADGYLEALRDVRLGDKATLIFERDAARGELAGRKALLDVANARVTDLERQCADLTRALDAARSEAAEARNKALVEAAQVCDRRSVWAEDKIHSAEDTTFAQYSLACDDVAEGIRALRTLDPEREAHEPGQQRTAREAGTGADDGRTG